MITMVKHLPFINLYTHARLDWKIFKEERSAANIKNQFKHGNNELKKRFEQDAKLIKGELQTFKMFEAYFESLPQVSQMNI